MNVNNNKLNTWDYLFFLWYFTDSVFIHTPISMFGQAVFILYSLYKCTTSKTFYQSYLFLLYGLFCGVCFLNIFLGHAIVPDRSRSMLGVVVRNLVFIFCAYQYIRQTTSEKFIFLFIKACCFVSLAILAINYFRSGMIYMHDDETLSGIINANMQSVINAFVVSWIILNRKVQKVNWFTIVLLLSFIILSGTKKSIIALLIIIGGFTILKNPKYLIRNLIGVAALFSLVYVLIMKVPMLYDMIGSRFESMFALFNGGVTDDSTNTRNRFIELGMEYWALSPIWGNGLNVFGVLWGDETTYSHNNYVELLCSVGIVGCISYYLFYLFPLLKSLRLYLRTANTNVLFALCMIISLLVSDYAMVTYFERIPYIELLFVYVLVDEVRYSNEEQYISKY